jgi:hypothetical protein
MIERLVQLVPTVVAALLIVPTVSLGAIDGDREALLSFQRGVDAYMSLRRQLDRQLPLLEVSSDPQRIHDAAEARRYAIMRARAGAKPGDIFNSGADVLRARIGDVFAGRHEVVASLLSEMNEHGKQWRRAEVNAPFVWRTAAATPASVLAVLPPLPAGVQYRFVGPDLVLIDVDAGVILDIVSDVLAPPTRAPR